MTIIGTKCFEKDLCNLCKMNNTQVLSTIDLKCEIILYVGLGLIFKQLMPWLKWI